ncbi:DUF2007 domain-containing protein [bacterium]|nr:DUF2007 domain-containing protein [bacterium]
MPDFVAIALFDSAFEIKLTMARNLLEQNGIEFFATNENFRSVEPPIGLLPQNLCIELRVPVKKSKEARQLLAPILNRK